jgi:hypothetical protein
MSNPDAALADTVYVGCGDPRFSEAHGDAEIKKAMYDAFNCAEKSIPDSWDDVRFDRVTGVSPVHMASLVIRGKADDFHLQNLWWQLNKFIEIHQQGSDTVQKVVFCVHTGCGAAEEPNPAAERIIIEDDLDTVSHWFAKKWNAERPDDPLPEIFRFVALTGGHCGDIDARVEEVLEVDTFLRRTVRSFEGDAVDSRPRAK